MRNVEQDPRCFDKAYAIVADIKKDGFTLTKEVCYTVLDFSLV